MGSNDSPIDVGGLGQRETCSAVHRKDYAMRSALVGVWAMGIVVGLSNARSFGQTDAATCHAKVEVRGTLQSYKMLLFRRASVAVRVGETLYWLDYGRHSHISDQEIAALVRKNVVVRGALEFNDIQVPIPVESDCCGGGVPVVKLSSQLIVVVESVEELSPDE